MDPFFEQKKFAQRKMKPKGLRASRLGLVLRGQKRKEIATHDTKQEQFCDFLDLRPEKCYLIHC